MPIFNFFHKPTLVKDKLGGTSRLSSRQVMQIDGLIVPIIIGIDRYLKDKLASFGIKIPEPMECDAVIDTGAYSSNIDIEIAKYLRLPEGDKVPIATPSHESHIANTYHSASITLNKKNGVIFEPKFLIGAPLINQGIGVLLGRDFLAGGMVIYNGATGGYTLAMQQQEVKTIL